MLHFVCLGPTELFRALVYDTWRSRLTPSAVFQSPMVMSGMREALAGAHTLYFLVISKERHHEVLRFPVNTIPDFTQRSFDNFVAYHLVVMTTFAAIAFGLFMALWTDITGRSICSRVSSVLGR